MTSPKCHNCRRRRLRCDRSVPGCNKCAASGQQCLGYGQLWRWTDSVASRGRMMGKKTFHEPEPNAEDSHENALVVRNPQSEWKPGGKDGLHGVGTHLIDPLFQDLDSESRHYLNYFASRFCQDMVVHDSPLCGANPFRDLIPLSGIHPFLRHIITATSAVHYSTMMRYASTAGGEITQAADQAATDALVFALRTRHKAIKGVQRLLEHRRLNKEGQLAPGEKDALFSTIVFFINFALIDTGKNGWRAHMKAAGTLIQASYGVTTDLPAAYLIPLKPGGNEVDRALSLDAAVNRISNDPGSQCLAPFLSTGQSKMLDYVVSDFIAYYVWSSTLDTLTFSAQKTGHNIPLIDIDPTSILPILSRTEANSYHSCPAPILLLILRTSLLARDIFTDERGCPTPDQLDAAMELLFQMQSFDTQSWAEEISAQNINIFGGLNANEIRLRTHIASTYQATACLYLLLVAPSIHNHIRKHAAAQCSSNSSSHNSTTQLPALRNTGDYAATILEMLSGVPPSSPFFKYTTWPVWMTGVETELPNRRVWVMQRLEAMLVSFPWGMLKSAMETLREIWQMRDAESAAAAAIEKDGYDGPVLGGDAAELDLAHGKNWILQLRGLEIDCLIV